MNRISVFISYHKRMVSRFFIRLMSPIRAKLASRESFATVYTTLLFMSSCLMNIDVALTKEFLFYFNL